MATMEERMKILQMVQEGKISPEDAAQLLEALSAGSGPTGVAGSTGSQARRAAPSGDMPYAEAGSVPGRKPRFLRVRVTDVETGRPRVNVRLPISMVSVGLKMGSKFAPQIEGMDPNELMKVIESGELGQIVDVTDDEDGEHVEVFLE